MRNHVRRFAKRMRCNFAGFLSETPRELARAPESQRKRKAGLELFQASSLVLTLARQLNNSDNNGACDDDEPGARCSNTDAHRSSKCGNMDSPRNSRNSCVGNSHNSPGNRNCCTGRPGNRIQFLLLQFRLKPERQLVLPELEPVRLLPMEVKEVFS